MINLTDMSVLRGDQGAALDADLPRVAALDVAGVAELISYRDRIPPEQRHFFCEIEAHRMRIANPRLLKWNTYGEVLALREYLAGGRPDELDLAGGRALTRMIIVSTDIHLRRVALVAERLFRGWPLRFQCCPVPRGRSPVWEEKWWTRRADRRYVISETLKLAAYRAILLMPESIIRGSLRLCRPRQNPGL